MDGSERLGRTMAVIRKGIEQGLHIGAQLYVSLRGEVIADVAVGEARRAVPMRTDTLMPWLSSGKPVTAVAIAQLWERGRLELDDPVARHIPEFAEHRKESITIRHLLTHTGGIRGVLGRWENQPWDQIIAAVASARPEPNWAPGQKAGYHAAPSWYILGEIVQRLDERKRALAQYVREKIFLPIGMTDSWMGMEPEQYRLYSDRIGLMHDTSKDEAKPNQTLDTEQGAAAVRPGAGARGPIRELGMFYETLLKRGRPILIPQTVEAMTARHRVGMYDQTFKHIIDWGLGFIINSKLYGAQTAPYGFGPHASPRTFGHSGSQSSTGFCDPEHRLAVAWVMNGMPGETAHQARVNQIDSAIYQDLGLVAA